MKILFVGGGSGGHITPNLAIIQALQQHGCKPEDFLYIGSKHPLDRTLVTGAGIPFRAITTGKLRRYLDWKTFIDPFKILWGIIQSLFILRSFRPNVLFSKGGFVSVPVVLAAWLCHVPIVTHESDMLPGLSDKIIRRFAQKVCVTFPKKEYASKEVLTGLPIRENLLRGNKEAGYAATGLEKERPVLLILGGSLGAQVLNEFVWRNLEELLGFTQVIHIVGKGNLNQQLRNNNYELQQPQVESEKLKVKGYVQYEFLDAEHLANMYAMVDVVLARSGATVVVELVVLQKPTVFVPLTTDASRGEQVLNAQFMVDHHATRMLTEKELTTQGVQMIRELLENEVAQSEMVQKMNGVFPRDAAEKIADLLREITKNK